jgi:hypothetical protein
MRRDKERVKKKSKWFQPAMISSGLGRQAWTQPALGPGSNVSTVQPSMKIKNPGMHFQPAIIMVSSLKGEVLLDGFDDS